MSNTIKVRRGTLATIPTLEAGEFGFTTDTSALYVGTGAANVLISINGESPDSAKLGDTVAANFVRKDADSTLATGVQIVADDHKITTGKATAAAADMCLTNVVFQTSSTLPTAAGFTKGTIILVHEA